jgi:hypothetical protein
MKLLEIRFEQSDEDDLLTNQWRTENVHRPFVVASSMIGTD